MFSSKVFKKHSAEAQASPFVMENLGAVPVPAPEEEKKEPENVGSGIEEIERQAYELGFAAGEKAGFELGRQKAEVLFGSMGKILDELASFKESLFKPCEKEMVDLCFEIAKKVAHREVEASPEVILDCVRSALKHAVAGGEITIRVNPKDLEVLLQHKGELSRFGGMVKGIVVEGDESIGKGGCVIFTNYGEIDATLESITAEVEEKLKDAYSGGSRS